MSSRWLNFGRERGLPLRVGASRVFASFGQVRYLLPIYLLLFIARGRLYQLNRRGEVVTERGVVQEGFTYAENMQGVRLVDLLFFLPSLMQSLQSLHHALDSLHINAYTQLAHHISHVFLRKVQEPFH